MPRQTNQQKRKTSLADNVVVSNNSVAAGIRRKINALMAIVQRTIVSAQQYKVVDVINANELKTCLEALHRSFVALDGLSSALDGNHSQSMW